VLYLRQSTHKEESISLELQETAGREYCKQRGYEVVAVEADPGISGRSWNRPAVQRVMQMVEAHEADVIVLWKWSRLSRSRLDWAVAVDKVESAGGRIESATEPLDTTTSAGRLARGMLAEFAAFESERIGDVWKESQQRRRIRGLPPNGGDRYGYSRDGDTYTPDAGWAPVLADLYARYAAGEGFTRLVRMLNESGRRTITGIMWTHDKLRQMLDSGFAAGKIIQGRFPNATYYPGVHPPIIDETLWDAYLGRRRDTPRPPRVIEPSYFLTGLIFCDDCGGSMRSVMRNGVMDGYGCARYLNTRMGRFVTCKRTNAEAHVLKKLREYAVDLDAQAQFANASIARNITSINDADALDREIAALDEQAAALLARRPLPGTRQRQIDMAVANINGRIKDLETRQRDLRRRAASGEQARVEALVKLARWGEFEPIEQREIVAAFIERVRVIPPPLKKQGGSGRVTFDVDWNFPR
jgi:DNA invertase Pin-like site-specific DNA recombinase